MVNGNIWTSLLTGHFLLISGIGVFLGLFLVIFFFHTPQVRAQYVCSGITYTLTPSSGNYDVNPQVANTRVDISRCTASSSCGWGFVGFNLDGIAQGVGINGGCGYFSNINTGAPGLHTMQFTTCSGASACNAQQFCTVPAPPQNLNPVTGTYPVGTYSITWNPVAGATSYPIRIDDLASPFSGNCSVVQNPGDVCDDSNTNTAYAYTFLAGHTYNVWVHGLNCGWSPYTMVTLTFPAPPTPTPLAWSKVYGGDVYQSDVNGGKPIPTQVPGTLFLNEIPGQRNTVGVVQSSGGLVFNINYLSTPKWFASPVINLFSFDSYWQTLSPLAKVGASDIVGTPGDISSSSYTYIYTSGGTYTLNTLFATSPEYAANNHMVIYLIKGNLRITNNFTLPPNSVAVFIVDGSVQIAGDVGNIEGLYIVNNTFNIEREPAAPITTLPLNINGMILTNALSLNRMYGDIATPTYEIIYQPQYAVRLLPVMGKSETIWQELAP